MSDSETVYHGSVYLKQPAVIDKKTFHLLTFYFGSLPHPKQISGAFVFGLMSFFDKLINGSVIALVQHLKPQTDSTFYATTTEMTLLNSTTTASSILDYSTTEVITNTSTVLPELEPTVFYLFVLVFVSGAAVIGTFLVLVANATKELQKIWLSLTRPFHSAPMAPQIVDIAQVSNQA